MSKLLFIDTNIYLDFYRIRNEVKLPFLAHLVAMKDRLIMTDQVEMEFKKNRQDAIFEGMRELKAPKKIGVPGVLRQDKSAQALNKDVEKIESRLTKLRTRFGKVLEQPTRYDQVYKVLQRLFNKKGDVDLYRKSDKRYEIREYAKKRFRLGYPPRKPKDTSIGDAINWEWLVYIAKKKNSDICIVSRDGDYGVSHDNRGFVNDWLTQEFKDRVHKNRNVTLSLRLSHTLKEFQVPVTEEEELEEEKIASQASVVRPKLIETSGLENRCPECGRNMVLFSFKDMGLAYHICRQCHQTYETTV